MVGLLFPYKLLIQGLFNNQTALNRELVSDQQPDTVYEFEGNLDPLPLSAVQTAVRSVTC